MALETLYQQVVLDHNRQPRNYRRLDQPTHAGRGQDALCGDDILVELQLANGLIRQAAFSGEACAITKASASLLTEWLKGQSVESFEQAWSRFQALMVDPALDDCPPLGEINQLRAVADFPARVRNALLPWRAAEKALSASSLSSA
ncbi:MAG: Fe-S cluster assembly sulfur transfer protein SufU [Wenzhouxiangella sp.]